MKKILVIQAHPDPESYCAALAEAYMKGAQKAGAQVNSLILQNLDFDPNLRYGYRKRMELEPDLLDAWDQIMEADHLVIVHPVWWGGLPAKAKGFFDRLFLPGMAYSKHENSLIKWDKLLAGKTGRIVVTMDQPSWYYYLYYWAPSILAVKKLTFEFTGVKPVYTTAIGPIRLSKAGFREKWLLKIQQTGEKDAFKY